MKLDDEIIPLPTARKQKDSLAEQMRNLYKGQSFTVTKRNKFTRGGLYATAKLAKVKITTQETALGEIRVWRTDGEDPSEIKTTDFGAQLRSGQFIPQGQIPLIEQVIAESGIQDEKVMSRQETIAGLKLLNEMAMSGITEKEIYNDIEGDAQPQWIEDWRFTKDNPQFDATGEVYRKQALAPDFKGIRIVQVDPDDLDKIVGIK